MLKGLCCHGAVWGGIPGPWVDSFNLFVAAR